MKQAVAAKTPSMRSDGASGQSQNSVNEDTVLSDALRLGSTGFRAVPQIEPDGCWTCYVDQLKATMACGSNTWKVKDSVR